MPEEDKTPHAGTHCLVPKDVMVTLAGLIVSMPYAQVAQVAAQMQQCEWVTLTEEQGSKPEDAVSPAPAKKKMAKSKGKKR